MTELDRYNFSDEIKLSDVSVVVFTAPWCSFCDSMKKVCESVAEKLPNAKFHKVNIDENPELATQYAVKSVPTTIVFRKGEAKERKSGLMGKSELYTMVNEAQ